MKKHFGALAILYSLVCSVLPFNNILAQGSDDYGKGLRINLDKEGDKYIRFLLWNQIWARSTENNPGTMQNGDPKDNTWDIGARRVRILAYAQISPRYMILTHFGMNNQTFINGGALGTTGTGANGQGKKASMFFHDIWNEYAIIPEKDLVTKEANKYTLYFGGGLHYWNGLSRMTSASTVNFLTLDAPILNWPSIENSDQFTRQFGFYAKGKLDRLWYQFSVNKPFATNVTPTKENVAVDYNSGKASFGGYANWEFWESESQTLPYRVGSYLGTKKVFNVGAGYYLNGEGTRSLNAAGDVVKHDIKLFSADVFVDFPMGAPSNPSSLTAYSVFYDYNFGPNYLRNMGIMNTGVADPDFEGERAQEGAGNARAMVGTGKIWYTQVGYAFPRFSAKSKARLQPFAAVAHKKFEALKENGVYWDLGANLLLDGQHAKISAQYSSRPLYNTAGYRFDRKGEWTLQLQIYL